MKQLYPIGTQLITRRLSQAALCDEIFCWKTIESCVPGGWEKGFWIYERDDYITEWRITVTEENQKWLSPVPMVGDLVEVDQRYSTVIIIYLYDYDVGLLNNSTETIKRIIERKYPNGQRAPLIEFDDVILPTKGEQS